MRDSPISLSNDHNGKNCPAKKQLIKCNMKTVVTMSWGPIGEWGTLDNGVMRLTSDVCDLTIYKTNGMKVHVIFSKCDFRYQVGDCFQCTLQRTWKYQRFSNLFSFL